MSKGVSGQPFPKMHRAVWATWQRVMPPHAWSPSGWPKRVAQRGCHVPRPLALEETQSKRIPMNFQTFTSEKEKS